MNKSLEAKKWVIRLGFTMIALSMTGWAVTGLVGPTLASMDRPGLPFGLINPLLKPALPASSMETMDKSLPIIKRPGRTIRVRLFADKVIHTLTISSVHGIQVGQKKVIAGIRVSQDRDHIVISSAGQKLVQGQKVQVIGLGDGLLTLGVTKSLSRRTNGQITLTIQHGALEVVNRLDLDTYAEGTVQPEMGSFAYPIEALKSQIIVSRSYVLALRDRHVHQDYDFCDTAHCLVYGGVGVYPARFLKAAAEVRGLVVTYKGHPAATFFHHSSGGYTAAIEEVWPGPKIPYLKSVPEVPNDLHPRPTSPGWSFTLDRKSLVRCFNRAGWLAPHEALDQLQVIQADPNGRALEILVQGSQPHWIQANHFRQVINHFCGSEVLRSTDYKIKTTGNLVTMSGRGWGHGIGLSQMGAVQMGRRGKTYQEILQHYFPGTQISNLPAKPTDTDPQIEKHLVNWLD